MEACYGQDQQINSDRQAIITVNSQISGLKTGNMSFPLKGLFCVLVTPGFSGNLWIQGPLRSQQKRGNNLLEEVQPTCCRKRVLKM